MLTIETLYSFLGARQSDPPPAPPTTRSLKRPRPRDEDDGEELTLVAAAASLIRAVVLPLGPSAYSSSTMSSDTKDPSASSSSPPSGSSLLPPPFLPETPPRGVKRPRLAPARDPQPNPAYLLAVHGIKHRDFAYESTLPPVPAYRPQQLLDHDGAAAADPWPPVDDGTPLSSWHPTSPLRGLERNPRGVYTQGQAYSPSQNSQRRRSLEREATEPAVDEPSSQPHQRAAPPPSRALARTRCLFTEYNSPFDYPASQPSQLDRTPSFDITPTSSPGSPPSLIANVHSQSTDDGTATPLVTPNGSVMWAMDVDQPMFGDAIDADAMLIDLPATDPVDLSTWHAPKDNFPFSQRGPSRPYGSLHRDVPPSPRTPPPAFRSARSPLRRESAFIGSFSLRNSHSPITPPPPVASLLAGAREVLAPSTPARRSPRFHTPTSPAGMHTPPGHFARHGPSPLSVGTPVARARIAPRAAAPPEMPLRSARPHGRVVTPAGTSAQVSTSAQVGPPAAAPPRAESVRSYNLRKRAVSPAPDAAPVDAAPEGRRVLRRPSGGRVPPAPEPHAATATATAAASKRTRAPHAPLPTPPSSQPEKHEARPPRTLPRGAFTIRSAHAPAEGAAAKAGRTIKEKSREAQQVAAAGATRTLRARRG